MNQQICKTARISSCSTKKSSTKGVQSITKPKKNLQSTFTKMSNPIVPQMGNSSVLTQKIRCHGKHKQILTNPQNQKTKRVKSSTKLSNKAISKLKTDRKAEYVKLKAKQLEIEMEKKPSIGRKSSNKICKKDKIVLIHNKTARQSFNNSNSFDNSEKFSNNIPQSDHIIQIKRPSNLDVLEQIQKNQRQLIQKIAFLQKQNRSQSQRNDSIINQIKYKHDQQVGVLKQQLKILNSKLNQKDNKNIVLQKKVQHGQKDYASLRQKITEKDHRISLLEKHNKSLQQQLRCAKDSINNYQSQVCKLQQNLNSLRSVKTQIEQKLKKCQKQKLYIKQNCVQVLSILREQFGQELKLISF